MNLWVRKTGPILGLALFLFACEEPGEIGLELEPDTGDFFASYIEIPIKTSVGLSEPYLTSDSTHRISIINVGNSEDETFGSRELVGYSNLYVQGGVGKIPSTADYDSIDLRVFATNFRGDRSNSNLPSKLMVHQILEQVNRENTISDEYQYEMLPLAEFDLDSLEEESTKSLRKKLSDDLGMQIFDEAQKDSLTNSELREVIEGLAFKLDNTNELLLGIDPFRETSLNIYYHYDPDTARVMRILMTDIQSFNVSTDYTGLELQNLTANNQTYSNTENLYFNSYDGIFSELDFTPVLNLSDSLGPIIINGADLTFEDIPVDTIYPIPASLYAFEKASGFPYKSMAFFQPDAIEVQFGQYLQFQMSYTLYPQDSVNGNYFVSNTISNEYTPDTRGPAFEDFIQYLVTASDAAEKSKIILYSPGVGRTYNQLHFNKDNVKLKIYFSYLQSSVN